MRWCEWRICFEILFCLFVCYHIHSFLAGQGSLFTCFRILRMRINKCTPNTKNYVPRKNSGKGEGLK